MRTSRRTFLEASAWAAASPALAGRREPGELVWAENFESRFVYRSRQRPSYTSWVSFFPGGEGKWYITCEEVRKLARPHPRMGPEMWYAFGLPARYDKSADQMEVVMLESTDGMKTWNVISRQPVRFQHSAGSFGQARTRDGRFLRFVWANYSLVPGAHPGEILYESSDGGKTWRKREPLHHRRFASYPHRLRTLRDGTLVQAIPIAEAWGPGTNYPMRTTLNLNAANNMSMYLYFSRDQGRTWPRQVAIFPGIDVAEMDFAELPSGDLLCVVGSTYAEPGRQILYRWKDGFMPGPYERARSKRVPETIAIDEHGLLVGCLRNSKYFWSDDLGLNWFPLAGVPEKIAHSREMYQPWMHYLGAGRWVSAGHYGADNFVGEVDQWVMLHLFDVKEAGRTEETHIHLTRDFDRAAGKWLNTYTLMLTAGGRPLPGRDVEVWFVERDKPGYDPHNRFPLAERIKLGGETARLRTAADGSAHLDLKRFDPVTSIHHTVQMVARFNVDRRDPSYKPAETPQFEFYSISTY